MSRYSEITRNTKETQITLKFNIDGNGESEINTKIPFFDHMLTNMCKHGFFNLYVSATGDADVDSHHTIEDIGIVLGKAINESLGTKEGIKRYGQCLLPMEEAFVLCAMDISGRPFLGYDAAFTVAKLGDMQTEMIEEFFRAVCIHAGLNLHIKVLEGKNNHHIAEAIFKAFGRTLDEATTLDPRINGVLSTKGMME